MKSPLTKEQRAEMRQNVCLASTKQLSSHFRLKFLEVLDSHALADEECERLQSMILLAHGALPQSWVYTDPQTTCDLLVAEITTLRTERDLATAKLATARVCEKCKGTQIRRIGRAYNTFECTHCTNGVVFSDERARELLSNVASLKAAVGFRDDILSDIRESIGEEGLLDIQVPDRITELLERLKRVEEDRGLLNELEEQWLEEEDCPIMLIESSKTFVSTVSSGKHHKGQRLREAIRAGRAKGAK